MKGSPSDVWVPTYKVPMAVPGGGTIDRMIPVEDCASKECPVSVMSKAPHMEVLAKEALLSASMFKTTGAFLQGQNTSKWDARWCDCVRIMTAENNRVQAAVDKFSV